nr:hypothetical protein [Tanacetum cinerariifolium]
MHNGDHVPAVPTTKNSPAVPEHTTVETLQTMSPENKARPYTLSTVVVPAVPTTKNSPAVPEHTTVETLQTMSPENKASQEMWEAIERLQQGSLVVQQSRIQCFNCKEFGHFAKECRKPKRVKDSIYHKEKMSPCKQAEQGIPLQAEHVDWLADTNDEIDEQELEARYSFMAKIQEVHCVQSKTISNTCFVEKDDSDVTPDSPDMCKNDIQTDQNAKDEQTSKTLEESNGVRDSYLVALQTKQTEFEKYKACNDRTVNYDKLKSHKTNVSRAQLRSNQMTNKIVPKNSHVKAKKTKVEDHHTISSISNKTKSVTVCNDSLKSKTLNVNVACATCGKCLIDLNHFACVTKLLHDVNARTKKPNVVSISTRKPKSQAKKSVAAPHKKTVASETTTQKSKSYYRMLHEKTSKAWKLWIE